MPHYRKHGKIVRPINEEAFKKGMETGHFVRRKHKAFCVLLYYTAVRKMEALRSVKEQFTILDDTIFFDVGERLKKRGSWFKETDPLPLPLKAPFMKLLEEAVNDTKPKKRVFPYCARTGYNIVDRVFKYPHLFRLSRITWFLDHKWSLARIRSWTGLSLTALEYYVGKVAIKEMGESLAGD